MARSYPHDGPPVVEFDDDGGPLDADLDGASRPSLHLHRRDAERYLDVVLRERRGYVAVAFGLDPYRDRHGRYRHRRWSERSFAWPQDRRPLLSVVAEVLAAADAGTGPLVDVYICPHLRRSDRRRALDAVAPVALHADLDGPPADHALYAALEPLRVESGTPGHEHATVMLAEPLADLARWGQLQRALRDRLGGGADAKIADNDVLRLPGTVSGKPTVPGPGELTPVRLLPGWSGRVWTVAEVAALLGVDLSVPPPELAGPGTVAAPVTVPVPNPLPPRVQAAADAMGAAPDKSAAWARLVGTAAWAGMSRDQAFAVVVRYGLPHIPRFGGREVAEFERCWAKSAAHRADRLAPGITLDTLRALLADDPTLTPADLRAELDGLDPTLWSTLGADVLAAERGEEPPPPGTARSPGPVDATSADRVPGELLAELLAELRTWQHVPDEVPIMAALALAVTAEDGHADPAWLLLVAAPSSGKTEVVRLMDAVAAARLDDLTVGGLLTWTKGKHPHPTGVLTRIHRGLITFGDLSTLLAGSDHGGRDELFALLRRVADGEVSRDVAPPSGARVDTALHWHGRVQVIAAVTGVIDRYAAHNAALGDRWLSCRMATMSSVEARAASRLCRARDLPGRRDATAKLVVALVAAARGRLCDEDLPDDLLDAIDDAAQYTAWARASVPRATYGRREIDDVPIIEAPMRLVRQLTVVARGLRALGLDVERVAAVVRRLARDSAPEARTAVLRALAAVDEPISTAQVAREATVQGKPLHWNVASRRLEELAVVGVVEELAVAPDGTEETGPVRGDDDGRGPDRRVLTRWRLAADANDLIRGVVSA